ncbi:MAG: DUF2794 domain-containing protein [Rhizobiales bacterium]|nr:DUF2794 domain-containing protein [Hyphomicrobiales bacterium]
MGLKLKNEYLSFHRLELGIILKTYGQGVATGKWKDYAIDICQGVAVFSIYRNASENPEYQIIKEPKLRNKQGQYRIIMQNGKVIKRGHDLEQVLTILNKFKPKLKLV